MQPAEVLPWLLEPSNPSARYLALVHLLDRPADDPEVLAARSEIPAWGPARDMLEARWPDGYWIQPGVGYSPMYKATIWQPIFLAWLGAPCIEPIRRAGIHVLDHSRLADGRFSAYKSRRGAILCLNGNLLRAMLQLGCTDPRVEESLEALASMVERDGYRCRFNAAGAPPARMRDGLPCAWGAIKALGAFAEVPHSRRSPAVLTAAQQGIDLLLRSDLAAGTFPTATEPSPLWLRFGFPLGYTSDLLEALDVLLRFGLPGDARLQGSINVVLAHRNEAGCWNLDYTPPNTWASFGPQGKPNKWVTIRALRVLEAWQSCQVAHTPGISTDRTAGSTQELR